MLTLCMCGSDQCEVWGFIHRKLTVFLFYFVVLILAYVLLFYHRVGLGTTPAPVFIEAWGGGPERDLAIGS